MNKKIILVLIIFLLTGCYDHQELNDIAILTATEINKIDDEFIINVQVVNPQAPDKSTNSETPFIIYTSSGKTIQEAYRNIKKMSPRYIYPAHLRIVIINEKIAREDINQVLDFYLRNPLSRTEFNILIGQNDNILSLKTPLDSISATSILESLKTSTNYLGISNLVTVGKLAQMELNNNTEIVLPTIKLIGETNESDTLKNTEKTEVKSIYKIDNLAIFKNNKLQDYLTAEESITYNIIKNNIKNAVITYECANNKYLSYEITSNKTKITTKDKKINIITELSGTINESTCNLKLNDEKQLAKLQNDISKYINDLNYKNIDNIRNTYNTDIFGFLDLIYKHDYNTYLLVKDTWYQSTFKNIDISINTKVNIISKGNIMEGIHEKN